MAKSKFSPTWSGTNDKIIVQEMLENSIERWHECREFVRKIVEVKAKNILEAEREDIIQNATIRISKALHAFKYQCALSTWLFGIVQNCIIDAYRQSKHGERNTVPLDTILDGVEFEDHVFVDNMTGTTEEVYMRHDELIKALEALKEYISTHSNSVRNKQIVDMVIFEDRSLEEAARAVGCSAPVAGYVVRSARRYVREKLDYKR